MARFKKICHFLVEFSHVWVVIFHGIPILTGWLVSQYTDLSLSETNGVPVKSVLQLLMLACLFGLLAAIILGFQVIQKSTQSDAVDTTFPARFKNATEREYESHAPLVQLGLRSLFCLLASCVFFYSTPQMGAYIEFKHDLLKGPTALTDFRARKIFRPVEKETQADEQLKFSEIQAASAVEQCGKAQVTLLVAYFCMTLGFFMRYCWQIRATQINLGSQHQAKAPQPGIVVSAYLDVLLILGISSLAISGGSQYHMAYIIPVMGIWWVKRHAFLIFMSVVAAILLRPILMWGAKHYWPALSLLPDDLFTESWTASFGALVFWIALAMLILLLKLIRTSLTDRIYAAKAAAQTAEKERATEADYHEILELLADKQEHIVFAKNRRREFTYANSILLQKLTLLLKGKNLGHNGKKITDKRPVQLKDILGRTDFELEIDQPAFLRSDAMVLGLSPDEIRVFAKRLHLNDEDIDKMLKSAPIFEDSEPSLDREMEHGLWTTKVRRVDPITRKITGLVGEAIDGYPAQMRRFAEHLDRSLPIYAMMKQWDEDAVHPQRSGEKLPQSRVVWCNRAHLTKLEPRLRRLVEIEYKNHVSIKKFLDLPTSTQLQMLDGGKGPTDWRLYHDGRDRGSETDPWASYSKDDEEIIEEARKVIKANSKNISLSSVAELVDARLCEWALTKKKVRGYPEHGWIERHRFPGQNQTEWVEVRKWPWIEKSRQGENQGLVVKGVLVIFEDVTQIHMRRNIVWRWTRRHLKLAVEATARRLLAKSSGQDTAGQREESLSLIRLEVQMIGWLRQMVDAPTRLHKATESRHELWELDEIIRTLEEMPNGCPVEFITENCPAHFERNGAELFAIVVALLVNAGQSTLWTSEGKHGNPREKKLGNTALVRLSVDQANNFLSITITDKGMGFEPDDHERIKAGLCWGDGQVDGRREFQDKQNPHRTLMPGGGILLVKYLLRGMLDMSSETEVPNSTFDIQPRGDARLGATARVNIPLRAFEKQ